MIARMLAHPEAVKASSNAATAAAALRQVSAPETADAVIDCWLDEQAGETVRQLIEDRGWRHSQKTRWFLYLAATGRFDAVQAIIAAKWKPADADQAALLTRLGELAPLLVTGAPEGLGILPLNPVYQQWLASGETGPLTRKSAARLQAMLKDETAPPDQIAALGTLRKLGQPDAATVAKAGLSEHWMVRWVAVHFGADLTKAMQVNDAGIEWFRRLSTIKDACGLPSPAR